MLHCIYFILNLIKIIFVCKRYYANAGAKLLKKYGFSTVYMGFLKRKNMKFNAILPLKWQNTADIVAILVGLKQETVSLMCRKCAGSVARWLHLSEEEDGRNSVSCITPYGMVHETLFLYPDDTERMWKQRQAEYLFLSSKMYKLFFAKKLLYPAI